MVAVIKAYFHDGFIQTLNNEVQVEYKYNKYAT